MISEKLGAIYLWANVMGKTCGQELWEPIGRRIAPKSGDWRAKIKLHISDAIASQREAERRVDQAVSVF
jgi:hypothetical protein